MSKRRLTTIKPAVIVPILLVAAILMVVAFGGFLTAGATVAGAAQVAATSTPAPATPQSQASAPGNGTPSADPAKDLTSATVDLHAGYIMDPYLLPVVGKSEKAASGMVKGCNGFVTSSPSVVLNWQGTTDQLNLFVYGDDDAVLAVQAPDGSFICNDDAGARSIQPLVTIMNPAPGAYKIYPGSARQGLPALGFLGITQAQLDDAKLADLDLSPMLRRRARPAVQNLPQLDPRTLLTGRAAIFGSSKLQPGFKPVQAFAAGGGEIAAVKTDNGKLTCAGYITAVPSYSFTWDAGTGTRAPQTVRVFFESLKDSSLAVITPDSQVLCGTNASPANLNPVVDIGSPVPGSYKVYVASMQPNTVVGGKLTITSDATAAPAILAPAGQ